MTPSQSKFVDALIEHEGDAKAAYLSVNPHAAPSTLSAAVSRNLNNPEIKQKLRRILDEEGITLEHCARKHKKFLNRTNGTGLKALELAYKLHGVLDDESKSGSPFENGEISIVISQQTVVQSPSAPSAEQGA